MSLRRTAAVTVAIAALTLVGCGSNDSSTAPDTAPPLAPTAGSAHARHGKVSLTWNHNSEADLSGYNVYLAGRSGAVKLNEEVLDQNSFVHLASNSGSYRFRITAVDRSGNESAPSPMVPVQVSVSNPTENGGNGESPDQSR